MNSDSQWSPLEERTLADLVTSLAGRLRAAWRDGLAPWGLSPHQGRALLVIGQEPGLRPTDLASRLRIAPRSVTEVVDALVGLGLVERAPDERDRRATTLMLSPAGHRLVRDIQGSREQVAAEVFDRVPVRDRAQLRRILGTILDDGTSAAPDRERRR